MATPGAGPAHAVLGVHPHPDRPSRSSAVQKTILVALIVLVSAGVLAVDFWTPRGTAEAALYIVAVLLALGLSNHAITTTAWATTALTVVGFFVSPPSSASLGIALLNRVVALTVIWVTALLGRQRATALRREQEHGRRWMTTVTSIGDGVIVTDDEGRVTFLNGVAQDLTGWTGVEAIGRPLAEVFRIVSEQTHQPVESPAERVLRDGRVVGLANHTLLIRRDGREVAIDDSAAPIRSDTNALVGVVLVFRDVSASRSAERATRDAYRLLQDIVQTIPDPILVKDAESRMQLANAATLRIIGKPADLVIGRSDPEFCSDRELAERLVEHDRRVLQSGQISVVEERLALADGAHHFLATIAPRLDEDGRVIGVVAVAKDITDRSKAEEQLREADRQKDTFLAMLAHELKQPLNALRAATGVLRLTAGRGDTSRPVETIERQVSHLARLVGDLTDASQIKRGKLRLTRSRHDLRDVLNGASEMLRATLSGRSQELGWVLPHNPIPVDADADRLRQVFTNLLVNASAHTPEGGRIAVSVCVHDGTAHVLVRDTGRGIPAQLLPRIFDLFVQGDASGASGGMGIGLSLAKGIVELHGGTIRARSDGADRGSEFLVTLPVAGDPHADHPPSGE